MKTRLINGEGWKVHKEFRQDVEPILEANKTRALDPDKGLMRKVASIPHVVTMKWFEEDGVYWPRLGRDERDKYLKRKLADPDYAYLRAGAT